ncbi:hypothetical protein [Dokdonia sp. LLG6352-1]|uniref:hypothetical protein n=1 Tax=Dokdonia sp. LLG6352-1 TaxID=3160831 RepID=UPI00386D767B
MAIYKGFNLNISAIRRHLSSTGGGCVKCEWSFEGSELRTSPQPLFEEGLFFSSSSKRRLGGDVLRVSRKMAANISPTPLQKRGFKLTLLLFAEEAGRRCF